MLIRPLLVMTQDIARLPTRTRAHPPLHCRRHHQPGVGKGELADERTTVTIAYLINQYPQTSHSFIRREIQALEARHGLSVRRFTVRRFDGNLADERDR